jgi:hypothetical protein
MDRDDDADADFLADGHPSPISPASARSASPRGSKGSKPAAKRAGRKRKSHPVTVTASKNPPPGKKKQALQQGPIFFPPPPSDSLPPLLFTPLFTDLHCDAFDPLRRNRNHEESHTDMDDDDDSIELGFELVRSNSLTGIEREFSWQASDLEIPMSIETIFPTLLEDGETMQENDEFHNLDINFFSG